MNSKAKNKAMRYSTQGAKAKLYYQQKWKQYVDLWYLAMKKHEIILIQLLSFLTILKNNTIKQVFIPNLSVFLFLVHLRFCCSYLNECINKFGFYCFLPNLLSVRATCGIISQEKSQRFNFEYLENSCTSVKY